MTRIASSLFEHPLFSTWTDTGAMYPRTMESPNYRRRGWIWCVRLHRFPIHSAADVPERHEVVLCKWRLGAPKFDYRAFRSRIVFDTRNPQAAADTAGRWEFLLRMRCEPDLSTQHSAPSTRMEAQDGSHDVPA